MLIYCPAAEADSESSPMAEDRTIKGCSGVGSSLLTNAFKSSPGRNTQPGATS